ncbi:MAG: phytoene/squalene synthase family protein [Planctomycetes bacterium]|nr:phytoene/squalene synthase family protein [Planctomycetota bacterium]
MSLLNESYEYCRVLTRQTAHNFRFSFLTLPREKRRAMNALYAFNRITDDFGDDPAVSVELRRIQLQAWRRSVRAALETPPSDVRIEDLPKTAEVATLTNHPALPAVADMVARHHVPHEYLFDVIDGVEMDLHPLEIRTFADLEKYCYRVAGAVGLCCIHVWGFRDERAKSLAVECGLALQLTNILRDLGEDASQGRIYLPNEDLQRFGYATDGLRRKLIDERFHSLMQFEVQRAQSCYDRAEELFLYLEPCGRPILRAMLDIYGGLLKEIRRRDFDVFSRRVSLGKWKKLWFAARALLRQKQFAAPSLKQSGPDEGIAQA